MKPSGPTESTANKQTFQALMARGQAALSEGDRGAAHDYWRAAAMLNPTAESVWAALLDVVDDPEDARICRENIRIINLDRDAADTQAETSPQSSTSELSIVPVTAELIDESSHYRLKMLIVAGLLGAAVGIVIAFIVASSL